MLDLDSHPAELVDRSAPLENQPKPGRADAEKLRVFISYSRDDLDFAEQLYTALGAYGFDCSVDRHGISGGEDWKPRLSSLIGEADTVVFVLSPVSARSEVCAWEVETAVRLGKRLIPIICRPLEGTIPSQHLRDLNYIFFHAEPKAPGSGFGTGLAELIEALKTDLHWLRQHTRYLQHALEWDAGGRPANRLLFGADITEFKAWAARHPKNAPDLTELHREFIRASEEEAAARSNAERRQLEAMAATQAEREAALQKAEAALKQAADARRRRTQIRNIALVSVSMLAILAAGLGWNAEKHRRAALHILDGATNIILKFQGQFDPSTKKEVFEVLSEGAAQRSPRAMRNLGTLYEAGIGVAQDVAKARDLMMSAAALGEPNAMASLGMMYLDGRGFPKDAAKAMEWNEKGASLGSAMAMNNLGVMYQLGSGVERNEATAREWYQRAADKGDPVGMSNIGLVYETGTGVTQNYPLAREWYEKSAALGYAPAMNRIGWLFDKGQGVEKSYAIARQWYERAIAKGDILAKENLERMAIQEAASEGRYSVALRLQEVLRARVEKNETTFYGAPGTDTLDQLLTESRYALQAREFAKALVAAERALILAPDDLAFELNRAHALMFLGRTSEAKLLYVKSKGGLVVGRNNQQWESAVSDDFREFRKIGITNPFMGDLENELGIAK